MKSVVLLSAGLDSTVNLYQAQTQGEVLLALTFDYGQKAALQEKKKSAQLTDKLGIQHQIIELSFFKKLSKSSLIREDLDIPQGSQVKIEDYQQSLKTAQSVWVPNRNGIFLNVAAGFAEALGAEVVIPGFNKEEATTFPDNSAEFMNQVTRSLAFSTANQVKVVCFTSSLEKTAIVAKGQELGVPWNLVWPCYQSYERWCGKCESCQRARRAFSKNKIDVASLFVE